MLISNFNILIVFSYGLKTMSNSHLEKKTLYLPQNYGTLSRSFDSQSTVKSLIYTFFDLLVCNPEVPQVRFEHLLLTAAAEITESIKCGEKHWLKSQKKKM